jgi:xanthine dehydrogenase YagS FAD-binding subunit
LQRTRCYYFYDAALPCNKREPGTGCPAIPGFNRIHAILGASEHCIAVNPSDMCVALAALEAVVRVTGTNGERSIPFADFHRLPGDTPQIDTNLQADEIITAIELAHDLDYNLWQLRVHLKRLGSWISICPGLRC